jgi:peptide/nickel transport system permease protein
VLSAIKSRSLLDRLAMGLALLAISAPVYWLGLMGLFFFSNDIGRVAHIFPGAGTYTPLSEDPTKWFTSLILPWLVLATAFAAFYARLLRSNLIDTMSQDYIRTARAKGLPERTVIWRHGVRAAITPIITILGLDIGILLGGTILTETVFNIPGVGRYAYEGIINSDLPVIQGTVLFGAFFIVVANLVVDIVYALLDPRVRYS